MADINIERKGRSPLPWIIGAVVLALLAFVLLRGRGGDDVDTAETVVIDSTAVMDTAPMPMAAPIDSTTTVTTGPSTTTVAGDTNGAATTDSASPTP